MLLEDLPNELLCFMLVFLDRISLDRLQLVSHRFNDVVRHCEKWSHFSRRPLARHTACLSIRAPNYKPRIEMKELRVYTYVNWSDLPHALRETRVNVVTVNVRALNGPFQLHNCEWMLYIRKIRATRKYWNRAVVNFEQLPRCPRITRAFMQQFLNASELRFPFILYETGMQEEFEEPIYNIILPKVTQFSLNYLSTTPNADVEAWLRMKCPSGMRRLVIGHGNTGVVALFRELVGFFRSYKEPLDHAMCVVVDQPHYLWDLRVNVYVIFNSMDGKYIYNETIDAYCYLRTTGLQPYLLILPFERFAVPTKRQQKVRASLLDAVPNLLHP
ncbi:hypothetical protein AAVH_19816 [Aphelenchoides avenae]|nr:hypothetical protein AAVH_19816 [Aphelenchus avenae]